MAGRQTRPILLVLLLLVSLGTGLLISMAGPSVPALAAYTHVRPADLGIVFTANFLAASIATIASGWAFDRSGPRFVLPSGLILMALGALGEGAAPTLPLLVVAALLAGCGIGTINVVAGATASILYPQRREAVLNLLNALFGTGAFAAPLLIGASLTRLSAYQPVYNITALLLALPALPLLARLPSAARGHRERAGLRALLAERALWPPIGIGFLYLGAEIGFAGWIVTILERLGHQGTATTATAASLFWLFLALGGIPTALLLRHGVAPARLMTIGGAGAALAAIFLALAGGAMPLALLACALIGGAFAPIFPLANAAAVHLSERQRGPGAAGSAIALVTIAGQTGAALIPPLQGILLTLSPALSLGMTALCSLLIAALAHRTLDTRYNLPP